MSKIDEILTRPELQSRFAWLYYANEVGSSGYDDIIEMLEQLRPLIKTERDQLLIKLGEFVYEQGVHIKDSIITILQAESFDVESVSGNQYVVIDSSDFKKIAENIINLFKEVKK